MGPFVTLLRPWGCGRAFLGIAHHCTLFWGCMAVAVNSAARQKRKAAWLKGRVLPMRSADGSCLVHQAGRISHGNDHDHDTSPVMISTMSLTEFGHVCPWHKVKALGRRNGKKSRRDRPTIAFGSPPADELRTVYLFLALSHSQRSGETLRCIRPRRRGLRTVLAPLSSSSALGHRQSFTLSPTSTRGRTYKKGKPL